MIFLVIWVQVTQYIHQIVPQKFFFISVVNEFKRSNSSKSSLYTLEAEVHSEDGYVH